MAFQALSFGHHFVGVGGGQGQPHLGVAIEAKGSGVHWQQSGFVAAVGLVTYGAVAFYHRSVGGAGHFSVDFNFIVTFETQLRETGVQQGGLVGTVHLVAD